ncbi:MAG TPA: hypothetical protein DEA55_10445 [Rhodospirillaceae bacterium]|nr:hypothetical protein [Rhodospirillaceae bacterium]
MSLALPWFTASNAPSVISAANLDYNFGHPVDPAKASALEGVVEQATGKAAKVLGSFSPSSESEPPSVLEPGEFPTVTLVEFTDGKKMLAQVRRHAFNEALEIGDAVFAAYEKHGVSVQRLEPMDGWKTSVRINNMNGQERRLWLTNYRPATGSFLTHFDEAKIPALGRMLARMNNAAIDIENDQPDLMTRIRAYSDLTSMLAYRHGAEESAPPGSVRDVLWGWPEFQKFVEGGDIVRSVNMFNPIGRHVLILEDGGLGLTSMATPCRGYVPMMTKNITYDTALAAYRSVLNADNLDKAMSTNTNEVWGNLNVFVQSFNEETQDRPIGVSELVLAMKRANALDTIFVSGYMKVTEPLRVQDQSNIMENMERVISRHMEKKERHLKVIERVGSLFGARPENGPELGLF